MWDDVALHLMREQTLLQILADRMHEVASFIERGGTPPGESILEGLEVHRGLVGRVHYAKGKIVADALAQLKSSHREAALAECRREHARADRFDEQLAAIAANWKKSPSIAAREAGPLLKQEADRIVNHIHVEQERLYKDLEKVIPMSTQRRVLKQFETLSGESAAAEARLQAWASRVHPSSD